MKNVAYAAIIIVIALPALAVDDSYICVADQSAGFSYDEATMAWKRVSFDVSQSKYLIKRRFPENDAAGAFGVYLLGADHPFLFCSIDEQRRWMDCDDTFFTRLRFHYEHKRFIKYFEGSYALVQEGQRGNASHIEIGRCNKI